MRHPPLPQALVYGTIGTFAQRLVPAIEGADEPWSGQQAFTGFADEPNMPTLSNALSWCFRLPRKPDTSDKRLMMMRRHTYRSWMSTVKDIESRRLLQGRPEWREAYAVWGRLGRLMSDVSGNIEERKSPFTLLKRCSWTGCECRVHAPAHTLKVCKGCWLVAYCGATC